MQTISRTGLTDRSLVALAFLNFFLADARDGLGPFLDGFLATNGWSPMTLGIIATLRWSAWHGGDAAVRRMGGCIRANAC